MGNQLDSPCFQWRIFSSRQDFPDFFFKISLTAQFFRQTNLDFQQLSSEKHKSWRIPFFSQKKALILKKVSKQSERKNGQNLFKTILLYVYLRFQQWLNSEHNLQKIDSVSVNLIHIQLLRCLPAHQNI